VEEPNPSLLEFVQTVVRKIEQPDPYDVPAFERDITTGKSDYLYNLHPYWSKKSPTAIAEYIAHFTKPGDLVVDPFCGSGTTGLAARSCGRNVLLADASPAAGFLAHHYCLFVTPEAVQEAYDVISGVLDTAEESYHTKCDRCGKDALVEFVVWSDQYQCPKCATVVALGTCPEVKVPYPSPDGRSTALKKKRVCPLCFKQSGEIPHREFVISPRSGRRGSVPIEVSYSCLGSCRPKRATRCASSSSAKARDAFARDMAASVARIPVVDESAPVATCPIPRETLYYKNTLDRYDIDVAADLYTPRNLAVLQKAITGIPRDQSIGFSPLLFITSVAHKASHLMAYNSDGVGRVTKGTYYIAPIRMEARPGKYIREALGDIGRHFGAKERLPGPLGRALVTVEDGASALRKLPDASVDYIFTDPPYAAKAQYGELNFLWEMWLGFDRRWTNREVVVNPYRRLDMEVWDQRLREVLFEGMRVLKPGRWMSICFHDTDVESWVRLQQIVKDVGLEIGSVTVLDPKQKSMKQITAEKVVKSDLVLNCLKPRSRTGADDGGTHEAISERVREIVVDTLTLNAGLSRDRLWDIVLRRLLSRGELARHRFDDLLAEVAFRSESGRWFLREEFENLSDSDIRNEEKAGDGLIRFARLRVAGVPAAVAAEIVLRASHLGDAEVDEKLVERYIRSNLIRDEQESEKFSLGGRLKGVEFYDCLFFYLTRWLKGRPAGVTPRRSLAEFLGEYLVRFKDGDKWMYRAPDQAEAQSLRKARQTGLGRRIRQYVSFVKGEGEFPKEKMPDAKTLVAWLKHAAAFGLAEEGVLLWEKGGLIGQMTQLSEDERYDAEDYYTQCKRRAGKPAAEDDELEGEDAEDNGGHE
jgi:DNA modification methylase